MGRDVSYLGTFTLINQLESNVARFSTGGSHSLVITLDERLVGFGNNIHMQAGIVGVDSDIL